jgi:hypothetical protein
MVIIKTVIGQYIIFRISKNDLFGFPVQIQGVDCDVTGLFDIFVHVKKTGRTFVTYFFAEKVLEKTVAWIGKHAPFKNPRKIPSGIFYNQGRMSPPDKNFIAGAVCHYFEQETVYIIFSIVLTIYGKTGKGKYQKKSGTEFSKHIYVTTDSVYNNC